MEVPDNEKLPGEETPLSNCFATTYALMDRFDEFGHHWNTLTSEPGTFKGFDILVIDPAHISADFTVCYEMCEFNGIIDQAKQMASLDWASVADNASRQLLVIVVDMPDGFALMNQLIDAATCSAAVVTEVIADDGGSTDDSTTTTGGDDGFSEDSTWSFNTDIGAAVGQVADCFAAVDKFALGEISGKLFSNFFNSEIKPLI